MRWLFRIALAIAVLSGIAIVGASIVRSGYAGKAQLIQRVEYDAASAELLGTPGTFVGSPQPMIIEDPKAFVKGNGPQGSKLVDEKYLRDHSIYPLQLQTVDFLADNTRYAATVALIVSAVVAIFAKIRLKKHEER